MKATAVIVSVSARPARGRGLRAVFGACPDAWQARRTTNRRVREGTSAPTLARPALRHSLRAFIGARASGSQTRRFTPRDSHAATLRTLDRVECRVPNGEPA